MQIIRALWGENENVFNEIPFPPMFENEVVYVWGMDSRDKLEKMGYTTILVKDNLLSYVDLSHLPEADRQGVLEEHLRKYHTDHRYSTQSTHFAHKLEALRLADKMFEEYLFLDWDITLAKSIDAEFFNLIRSKGDFQCPIYAYCEDWLDEIVDFLPTDDNNETLNFVTLQDKTLTQYSWKLDTLRVSPCACFIYSNNAQKGQELLDIFEKNNLRTCIEEYAIYLLADCSLDEYIEKYDPVVLNGKEFEQQSEKMTDAIQSINKYVSERNTKYLYLYHDI